MNLIGVIGSAALLGGVTSVPVSAPPLVRGHLLGRPAGQIEGTVVQFLFRNPHSFVHVMAPDKNGVMQRGQSSGARAARSATRASSMTASSRATR